MNEMISVKDSSYARYEKLLIKRDDLKKEAYQLDREYIRVFGDRMLKNFELKIDCIRKKKMIAFCQMAINQGRNIDQDELNKFIEKEMAEYQKQLHNMVQDNNNAKNSRSISQIELLEIKRIYRKLAKLIHPDINPRIAENSRIKELWERISVAYKCNNLKEMRELDVLTAKALSEIGGSADEIDIPDINDKISELEKEIDKIINTDPYLYRFILEDKDAVKEKNAELDEEYDSYQEYSKQLDEMLDEIMKDGVFITWKIN